MANKGLFKSLVGKLIPQTDAVNSEFAPAYAFSPKHALAQYTAILNIGGFSDQVFEVISQFAEGTLAAEHWVGVIEAMRI